MSWTGTIRGNSLSVMAADWRFALRRIAGAVPTLLLLVTLSFFLVRIAPGGPFDSERSLPPETAHALRAQYHLDEPLVQQYFRYLGQLLRGDLGPSFQYHDYRVSELIAQGLPVSATLGGLALLLALLLGLALGGFAARAGPWGDRLAMSVSMLGISIPVFVTAPLLILGLAVYLDWLPAGGWHFDAPSTWVLPVVALALPQVAYIARIFRASLIEVMDSDYIQTARALGVSPARILLRYAGKPALLPVISYLGPAAAGLLSGSVVIEQIFGLPGIGRDFVQGALNRDYTLVLGVVLFYGVLIVAFNLLVDLLHAWLDPRSRGR